MTIDTTADGVSEGLPARHIEAFLEHLRTAGYVDSTLRKKQSILTAFARWMKGKTIALAHLDESAIGAFVSRSACAPATRVQFELAVLRLLLTHLRSKAIVQLPVPVDDSSIDLISGRYVDYLRQDRGLAENSVHVYAPFIRDFLRSQNAGVQGLKKLFADENFVNLLRAWRLTRCRWTSCCRAKKCPMAS